MIQEQPENKNTDLDANVDNSALEALISQLWGTKGDLNKKIELPDPSTIDPISNDQIKTMRKVTATKVTHKQPLSKVICEAIIRSFFETIDFFKPSVRAQRCLKEGHECVHCGQKFQTVQTNNEKKESQETGSK